MGRVKELQMERMEVAADFQNLVSRLLELMDYRVIIQSNALTLDPEEYLGYDLMLSDASDQVSLADVKIYASSRIPLVLLSNAIKRLCAEAIRDSSQSVVLVVSLEIPAEVKEGQADSVNYRIVDLRELAEVARRQPQLAEELADILQQIRNDPFEPNTDPLPGYIVDALPLAESDELLDLVKAIETCPASDGPAYERVCERALRAIFDREFNRWTSQQLVEDGFHKLDLIAQLAPTHDFWSGLRSDFRTRYVVFEFKNYAKPITQNAIYTTEKYLFQGALRTVAIIIARNGEDHNAKRARQGALREQGKLILTLTQADLVKMIELFRSGDDHNVVLIESVDNLLRTLGR